MAFKAEQHQMLKFIFINDRYILLRSSQARAAACTTLIFYTK